MHTSRNAFKKNLQKAEIENAKFNIMIVKFTGYAIQAGLFLLMMLVSTSCFNLPSLILNYTITDLVKLLVPSIVACLILQSKIIWPILWKEEKKLKALLGQ